ncbi:S8 family serine peptidase [Kitasatospora brasiliensis]|uniref:S8 family serine peptidase n=1 Tax=Kitasatospora brasiliensis TaxID=3058040 RepID=UPI00292F8D72|nr:S8 family serine peptidase [Kitasatospora sp. K002]
MLGAALVATLAAPAGWAAPDPAPDAGADGPAPGRPVQVTLVTGDTVTALVGADGAVALAGVRPGPGREDVTFLRRSGAPGSLNLLPSDAVGPLDSGQLDPRLFDVAGLIAQGYDDAHTAELPLILGSEHAGAPGLAAVAPPAGATAVRALESVHGAALRAPKARAGELWQLVARPGTGLAAGGVDKVWLDGKVSAALDRSTAQIGAPQAWSSGWTGKGVKVAVLDSGIDRGHPDVAGSLGETSDFTGPVGTPVNADPDGHGTHVASIVAGTGAASDGRFKGVAPDAELLVGRVLNDEGQGQESWVLQGMEWAAARAPIVNMSLTGPPTDGTDPMAQAVNTLSARYGTLFVAAAGNSGRPGTVGTPGSADAALTVGAVDRDGALASLSSRGPRVGDQAVKPDLTAPGVGIVAARAAGTDGQEPVGDRYTAISGTSMAAPHVAGAAALLAQQHPQWKGPQLKAALTSSASPAAGQGAYEQGAGRVDLVRATTQEVYATAEGTGIHLEGPPGGEPLTRTVQYHNDGREPVTLDLAVETTAAAGAFTVSPVRLTVPAGAAASATVTADPARVPSGASLTGRVRATGPGGAAVTTAYALTREAVRHDISVTAVDRNGTPLGPGNREAFSVISLANLDTRDVYQLRFTDGTATARVPEGRYNLGGQLVTPASGTANRTATLFLQPELELRGDTRLTVDAREGRQLNVTVPGRATTGLSVSAGYCYRTTDNSAGDCADAATVVARPGNVYVVPTARPTAGRLDFVTQSIQQGPAGQNGRLPDRYDLLVHTTGRLPDPALTVEPGELATLNTRYLSQGPGTAGTFSSFASAGGLGALSIAEPTFALPATRTEYFTVKDQLRETLFGQTAGPGGEMARTAVSQSGTVRCAAGATCAERWNAAVIGPGLAPGKGSAATMARTSDGYLTVHPQLFSDAAAGHIGSPWPHLLEDSVRLELERDGQRVGGSDREEARFAVPAADAAYRLTARAVRAEPWAALSGTVEAVWTFRSAAVAPGPDGRARSTALPVDTVRFTAPVDPDNQAPRRRHTLLAAVERQSGAQASATASLSVRVSFDDGATWQDAPVAPADGGYRVAVDPPQGAGGFVSLKATARAADGSTVEQTVLRAYRLAP